MNIIKKFERLKITDSLNNKNVLDVGCGKGENSFECEQRGAKVIGIEPNPVRYFALLKKRNELSSFVNFLRMYPDDINELNYQFDFVFISRTFDAVLNQGEFLKYVFQKLKNDGKLCLEIFTSTEKKDEIFTDKLTRPNGHLLQYPNEFTIKKLLEEAGFKKIEIIEKNIQDKKQRCVIFTTKGNSTPQKAVLETKTIQNEPNKRRQYQTFSEKEKGGSDSITKLPNLGIPSNLQNKTVLDLGCNEGFFCFETERLGAKAVGLEKSEYWYGRALEKKEEFSSSVEFINKSWDDLKEINSNFDLILFLAAFHYVKEGKHLEVIKTIYEKLNDGGLFILEVGLSEKEENKFFIESRVRPKTKVTVRYPNKFTIEKLLKDSGFEDFSYYSKTRFIHDSFPRFVIHAYKNKSSFSV